MILIASAKSNGAEKNSMIFVQSIHEVEIKVEEILKTQDAKDVLVVFDVDMTLTQPEHPATYYPALKKYSQFLKEIFKELSPYQRDTAVTLTTKLPQRLIEKDSPKIISRLQAKGIKIIAFTASLSGSWKDSKDKIIFKRRDALQRLGFNFSFSGRVVSYMDFSMYADGYPILYHGVLCANGENNGIGKGKVLEAFLKQVSHNKDGSKYYVPKVVVMVDDKKKNLEDIQKVLLDSYPDIEFIGVEYQGTFNYAPKDVTEADFIGFWNDLANQAKALAF